MATQRTRRLVAVGSEFAKGNAAARARKRLQKKVRNLIAEIQELQRQLREANELEELYADAMANAAGKISDANAEPEEEEDLSA